MDRTASTPAHECRIRVGRDMVAGFAQVTGDDNPLHLDADYAAKTAFGRPIAHGALVVGLISKVLGTEFPGPGTVYLSQSIDFLRPVPVPAMLRIEVSVLDIDEARRVATLSTNAYLEDGTQCAVGRAQVRLPA